jgi:hypothetical protein
MPGRGCLMLGVFQGGKTALLHKLGKGGGAPPAGASTFLGLNLIDFYRSGYYGDVPFTNLWHGDDYYYLKGGNSTPLPGANRDANGWCISVPVDSDDGIVYYVLRYPLAPCVCTMTWDAPGTFDFLSYSGPGFTVTPTGPQSATVTFTAGVPNYGIAQLKMTPNAANPPKNIQIIPNGRSGIFTPEFKARVQAQCRGGWLRLIKWHPGVEAAAPVINQRNTTLSAIWQNDDGVPFEYMLQLCAETAQDPWFNFALQEADSVIVAKLALLDAWLTANPSRLAAIQSSNEDWNSLYWGNVEFLRGLASANGTNSPVAGAAISSITRVGTTATVTTATAHGRATGDWIKLAGATPAGFNTTGAEITVTGANTYTYVMPADPGGNATVVGSYTYGSDIFGGQLRESARRSSHVMDLVAANISPGNLARVTRVLGSWNANPNTTDTLLAFSGTIARHDVVAVGAYWSNKGAGNGYPTEQYPPDGTTRTAPFNVQYTAADFDGMLADLKLGTDVVFDNAELNRQKAALDGLGLVGYEFGIERKLTSTPIATSWYESQQVDDATIYALQEWERRFNVKANWFVQTGDVSLENNAGRSLQMYLGQSAGIGAGKSAKAQAVSDFFGNLVRKPNPLVGTLATNAGDANGTIVGQLTKFVRNSTITVQAISGGVSTAVLAVGATTGVTAAVTVANTGLIPAVGAYTVTLRETNPLFPAPGYRDTDLAWNVSAALLTDNFNDNNLDPAQWTSGVGLVSISGVLATGVTIADTNQQLEITEDASGTANRGMALQSVPDFDLTTSKPFVKQVSSGNTARAQGIAFGTPGGNVFHVNRSNGRVELRAGDASYSFLPNTFSAATYSIAAYPWLRAYKNGANLIVEAAPAAASNPPIAADWVQLCSNTWPASVPTSAKWGPFQYNAFGGTANAKYVFDGVNTAT